METAPHTQQPEYPMIRPKALDLLLVFSILLFFFAVMLWWAVGVNDDMAAASLMWIIGIAWMASTFIWTMLFGVGLLSSAPYLPGHIRLLGLFYLVAGGVMAHAARVGLSSPWPMGLTFCGGQLVAAAILREIPVVPAHDERSTPTHSTTLDD